MSKTNERGRVGEEHVGAYLTKRGWTVLERNYRVRGGEIDIIAERSGVVAFVEVKTRKFGSLAEGMDAVDAEKRKHIIYAADRWAEEQPDLTATIRFDVAEVVVTTEEHPRVIEMRYYEDAFDAFAV